MTWPQFDAWSDRSIAGFAEQQARSGQSTPDEAFAYARGQFASLLPDGLATPLHHFWTVQDDGRLAGHLWVRVRPTASEVEGYVYDIELAPDARGRGLGRLTMQAAEREVAAMGATTMRLNVFGHNEPARRLYRRLGFVPGSTALTKRLRPSAAETRIGQVEHLQTRVATQAQLDVHRADFVARYTAALARSGAVPAGEADDRARDELNRLPPASGSRVLAAYDGPLDVARVWLHEQERPDGLHVRLVDVTVHPEHRGRGYGRSAVALAEATSRDRRAVALETTLLGDEAAALEWFEGRGFEITAQTLWKPLPTDPRSALRAPSARSS